MTRHPGPRPRLMLANFSLSPSALSDGSTSNNPGTASKTQGRMTLRSVPETIKSLRATLKQLEQTTDTARNSMDFARLKRIFLKRIAGLESERARATGDKSGYKIAT